MSKDLLSQFKKILSSLSVFSSLPKPVSSCIGLDVGSFCVKAVRLVRTTKGLVLSRWAIVPVSSDQDRSSRIEAIRTVLKQVNGSKGVLVTSVGGPGTILRFVLFPQMTSQELSTALSFEVEKHIPFKAEEAILDFWIVGNQPGGRMEVLLAVAQKELVGNFLELLKEAHVQPNVVDVEAIALANAWEMSCPLQEKDSGCVVLMHVGARGTILNFFLGREFRFTREVPAGAKDFTQNASQGSQRDSQKLEEWFAQCRTSFDFYENQFGWGVSRIFLSGGAARTEDFSSWVQEASGLPTVIWNPLEGIPKDPTAASSPEWAPDFSVAVGLAARGLAG